MDINSTGEREYPYMSLPENNPQNNKPYGSLKAALQE
jgi:hypothetical protein